MRLGKLIAIGLRWISIAIALLAVPTHAEISRPDQLNWGWEIELTPYWFAPGLAFYDLEALTRLHPELRQQISEELLDRYFEIDPVRALNELPTAVRERLTQGLDLTANKIETENLALPGNSVSKPEEKILTPTRPPEMERETTILGPDKKAMPARGVLLGADGKPMVLGKVDNRSGGSKSQILLPSGHQEETAAERQRRLWKTVRGRWKQLGEQNSELRREIVNFKYLPKLETAELIWFNREDLKLDAEFAKSSPRLAAVLADLVSHNDGAGKEYKPPRNKDLSKEEMLEQIRLFQMAFKIPDSTWTQLSPGISLHLTVSTKGGRDISRIAQVHSLLLIDEIRQRGISADSFRKRGAFSSIKENRSSPGRLRADGSYEVRMKRPPSQTVEELESALTRPEPEGLRGLLKRAGRGALTSDPFFHLNTVNRLEQAKMKVGAKRWLKLLQDPSLGVRQEAFEALKEKRELEPALVTAVVRALGDRDHGIRETALALVKRNASKFTGQVPALLSHLEWGSTDARVNAIAALTALSSFGPAVVHAIGLKLQDPSADVRLAALNYVVQVKPPKDEVISREVIKLVQDPWDDIRLKALQGLNYIDVSDPNLGKILVKCLNDASSEIQREALFAIAFFTPNEPTLNPALVRWMGNGSSEIKIIALKVAARVTPQDPAITSAVIRCLGLPSLDISKAAKETLMVLKPTDPESSNALLELVDSQFFVAQENAIALVSQLMPQDPRAVTAVTRILRSDYPSTREVAIDALAGMNPDANAVQAVEFALNDNSLRVRNAAKRALAAFQSRPSSSKLLSKRTNCAWPKVGG